MGRGSPIWMKLPLQIVEKFQNIVPQSKIKKPLVSLTVRWLLSSKDPDYVEKSLLVRDTAKINISCLRWHCIKEEPLFWHGNHCMGSGTHPEIVCEHCSPCHPQMQVKVQSCNEETDVWQCDEDPEMLPCSVGQSSFKMDCSSVVRQAEDHVFFRKTILNCILKLFQQQSFVVEESGLSEVQTFGCFLCSIVNKIWFYNICKSLHSSFLFPFYTASQPFVNLGLRSSAVVFSIIHMYFILEWLTFTDPQLL